MVFDAILTSRQTRDKLQCLYEDLRESLFNMTRGGGGGGEDIETRSLKFWQPPSLAVQFFRSPLLGSQKNFRAPPPPPSIPLLP